MFNVSWANSVSQSAFAGAFAKNPGAAAISFAALHFLALSAVTLLTQTALDLDVLEQVAWAKDPQWAYAKHPPLPAWIMAAALWIGGDRPWIAALLGPLTSALGLFLVWKLACEMMRPGRALIALFLAEGVIYFNFASIDFNHNVILLPLWALIALCGHRAYRMGKTADWALLGLAMALGLLGKYVTALLGPALLIAFAADPLGRRRLRSFGPAFSVLCCAVILAPHLWGLRQIDFAPFTYAGERVQGAQWAGDHFLFPLSWLGVQLLNAGPAIGLSVALLFAFGPRANRGSLRMVGFTTGADLRFTAVLFATPLLIAIAVQAIAGVKFRDMWGFPLFVLFGPVIALLTTAQPLRLDILPKLALAAAALLAIAVTAVGAVSLGTPYLAKKGPRQLFPAQELASEAGARWNSLFGSKSLRYVVADPWLGGMFTAYHADRPSVLLNGDFRQAYWIAPEAIDEAGAILVWDDEGEGAKYLAEFPAAIRQASLTLSFHTAAAIRPAVVGWAILPPASAKASAYRSQ